MTADELLGRLSGVRRTARGWQAKCPAHRDRSPSFSVREGERGLLLHCFAGCSLDTICHSLGLKVRELFYNCNEDPREWRESSKRREADRRLREQIQRKRGLKIDAAREAENLVLSAREIDVSTWSNAQLDQAINRLADAYGVLEREEDLV